LIRLNNRVRAFYVILFKTVPSLDFPCKIERKHFFWWDPAISILSPILRWFQTMERFPILLLSILPQSFLSLSPKTNKPLNMVWSWFCDHIRHLMKKRNEGGGGVELNIIILKKKQVEHIKTVHTIVFEKELFCHIICFVPYFFPLRYRVI